MPPSKMTWEDTKLMLEPPIVFTNNLQLQADIIALCTDEEKEFLKETYSAVDVCTKKTTEGEACFRIFTILLTLCKKVLLASVEQYSIQVQPSVEFLQIF